MTILTRPQRAQLIEAYLRGDKAEDIASTFGVKKSHVRNVIRRDGLPAGRRRPPPKRGLPYDFSKLLAVPGEDEAHYWLGLWFADGCLSKQGSGWNLILGLTEGDRRSLLGFLSYVRSPQWIKASKPCPHTGRRMLHVRFYSTDFEKMFAHTGIGPHKTATGRPGEYLRMSPAFWRGLVDGDGCVGVDSLRRPYISITGTKATCEDFIEFCRTIVSTTTKPLKRKGAEAWQVQFLCKKASLIIRHLYLREGPAMARKRLRARKAMSHYPS